LSESRVEHKTAASPQEVKNHNKQAKKQQSTMVGRMRRLNNLGTTAHDDGKMHAMEKRAFSFHLVASIHVGCNCKEYNEGMYWGECCPVNEQRIACEAPLYNYWTSINDSSVCHGCISAHRSRTMK
jgi:hypothetical protein